MGFTGVTGGSATRCLTMGTATAGAERRNTPTPGARSRPACAEPLPFPLLHTGLTRSRNAGEGGACTASGAGQPPKTPCVST